MNKKLTNVETEIKLFDKLSESKNHTQRSISKDLGIALGVANALIKKFLKKGLLKLRSAPMKRYFYYVTTEGFVEKAKLVKEYVHSSLDFYRKVRTEYDKVFKLNKNKELILVGISELTEIAILSANLSGTKISYIYDSNHSKKFFYGIKVINNIKDSHLKYCFVLTQSYNSQKLYKKLLTKKIKLIKPKFLKMD